MALDDRSPASRFLIRDRDTKFSRSFNQVIRSEGARVIVTPVQAPNANAHAERVIETTGPSASTGPSSWVPDSAAGA